MNALKTSLLAATAASSLLLSLAGVAGAQPPARGSVDAVPARPVTPIEGSYCSDESGGQVWLTTTPMAGVYCAPNTPPAREASTLPFTIPGDPDQGSQ
jgi:hypothetical protein